MPIRSLVYAFKRLATSLMAVLVLTTAAQAQEARPPAAAPEPEAPAAIPMASIAVQAATLESHLKSIASDLPAPDGQQQIIDGFPELDATIVALAHRAQSHRERGYDRTDMESLAAAWQGLDTGLGAWQSTLVRRLDVLDKHRSQLEERIGIWTSTSASAGKERAPAEVRTQISEARAALRQAADQLRRSRDKALSLQKRVVTLQARVREELDSIARAREEVLAHVLRRNAPSLWAMRIGSLEKNRAVLASSLSESAQSLTSYAKRKSQLIAAHLLLIAFLVWLSSMARTWVLRLSPESARSVPAALTHPLAAGLVLGLSCTMWIHSEAPPKLGWVVGVLVLPFWFFVLGSLLPRSLRRPLIGLAVLVLLDLARRVLIDLDTLSRILLVVEAGVALAGLLRLRRPERLSELPRAGNLLWFRFLGFWLHLALFGAAISLGGAILGWTSLGDLLLSSLVMGTFMGSILLTAVLVLEAIAEASTRSGKLDGIRVLARHPEAFLGVLRRTARTVGFVAWIYFVLGRLEVQSTVLEAGRTLLADPLGYGGFQITLGGLVAFGFAIWISWLLARLLPALLEHEVFTRVSLPRGVPYAVSTISRYAILVLGFVIAVAALGFEVGNLALVLSALGVGIGFGMQNMVNNFVSSLILFSERPIQVGDLVSLDQLLGRVTRIGVRSSTLRTFDGADVIVPNGDLISNQVTNWTLADTRRRVIVPVGVTYGTPAREVIDLLVEVARANPDVIDDPAPYGLFTGFGDSSLDFELRAWTESGDAMTIVRSDLAVGIQDALVAANIEVPFPQRDLHVKTVPT